MAKDTYPLIDRIVGGGLHGFLKQARERGDSYETISRRLAVEHQVEVTSRTIHRWCVDQGIEPEAASA